MVRLGWDWRVALRFDTARRGKARQERLGEQWRRLERQGEAGGVRLGLQGNGAARAGKVWRGRRGNGW